MRLFHITTESEWAAAQRTGEYRPRGYATERFIHCSYTHQVRHVADRLFRGRSDLVLLEMDDRFMCAPVFEENLEGGTEQYPHLYGPLAVADVLAVHGFEHGADGCWANAPEPESAPSLKQRDYLVMLMTRVAEAMEAVAVDVEVAPYVSARPEWVQDQDAEPLNGGYWAYAVGFEVSYPRGSVASGPFWVLTSDTPRHLVRHAAEQLMSNVQDDIAERTTQPWPMTYEGARKDMALPEAEIVGDELRLWYGRGASPVLKLPVVSL